MMEYMRATGPLAGWLAWARHWRRKQVSMPTVEPIRLAELLRQVPGKWVALRNGEIVDASETLDQLVRSLKDRNIKDVTVMRAPAEHEPELVGFG